MNTDDLTAVEQALVRALVRAIVREIEAVQTESPATAGGRPGLSAARVGDAPPDESITSDSAA